LAQLGWGLSKKGVVVINRPAAANTKFNQIEHNRLCVKRAPRQDMKHFECKFVWPQNKHSPRHPAKTLRRIHKSLYVRNSYLDEPA